MKVVVGIDPGNKTGIAFFTLDDKLILVETKTIHPLDVGAEIEGADVVYIEDSRLQKAIFCHPSQKVAYSRSVGQIDARCADIEEICKRKGIKFIGISPKEKGRKINKDEFMRIFGCSSNKSGSNQHERDAAMVVFASRFK